MSWMQAAKGAMSMMGGGGGGQSGSKPTDWTQNTPNLQTKQERNVQIAKQSPVDDESGKTRTKLGGVF